MSSTLIAAGLGLAAVGFAGRFLLRHGAPLGRTIRNQVESLPSGFTQVYRGGFEAKMSRREAALILGISPSANRLKVKEIHKRLMGLNHPDRGGSPYLAAKINEAKDLLEQSGRK